VIKHIVMWKLKDRNDAPALKHLLEGLNGRIPGLRNLEVGIDFLESEQSVDLVLVAELEDRAALDAYQTHPEHQAVLPPVKAAVVSRHVVDYEI